MILEYHRPTTLEEALHLLARPQPPTRPLGGGTLLNRPSAEAFAVVDLQALALDFIQAEGNTLRVGATLTLQALLDYLERERQNEALRMAIQQETTYNLRQVATVAGTLVAATGRSSFATAMLALDSILTLLPGEERVSLGDLLPLRAERLKQHLIQQIALPLNARLAYERVARTPADWPLLCVAVARWPSGRTRVAVGGFGPAPTLAFDGSEPAGAALAAAEACAEAEDVWASAEYRRAVAPVLVERCLNRLS